MPTQAKRRGPRAALLVFCTAAIAAAVVVLLGFKTTKPVPPPGIPRNADLLTVTSSTVGRAVPDGFVGLSIELPTLIDYAGTDPRHPNPVFVNLLRQLDPGGHPSLRIGGNSSDRSYVPARGVKSSPGVPYAIPRYWVPVARALARATGARLTLGLNLEANDPKLLQAEVRAMAAIGTRSISAFEIGNEPEKWPARAWYFTRGRSVFGRPRSYDVAAYIREFSRSARLVPSRFALAGPAVGNLRWLPEPAPFLAAEPRVRDLTYHLYPLTNCVRHPSGSQAPTIANLASPAASTAAIAPLAPLVHAAHAHHVAFRLDELNSVACSGAAGVSDRLASALWALDTLFALARQGVDGVNFHTHARAAYRTFRFRHTSAGWRGSVTPLLYGMLAFAQTAPAGARLLQTSTPTDPALRIWATTARGHLHVVLINASPHSSRTVAIKLPAGAAGTRLTFRRLTAPGGLAAADAVTLGGQGFGAVTTTGQLSGPPRAGFPRQVRRGIYLLTLPAGSAALLSR